MPSMKRVSAVLGLAAVAAAAPCDIYGSGGTPCVAAHGTTRALYDNYNGRLYQITRTSDGATTDIWTLSTGGVANAGAQDSFCQGTVCLISIIYDQSGNGNHLTDAPPGGEAQGPDANGYDSLAAAIGAPVTLNGKKAYGVFIQPFSGYRNDNTNGVATGDEPEGMYAVLDGTHYNGACCFDYGNAETTNTDPPNGNGHMEAIYLGEGTGCGTGAGAGPWVMADLENGIYSYDECGENQNYPSQNNRFQTAVVKGEPGQWAIRAGNGNQGNLTTYWSGPRPSNGYNPMSKEGAIILGIGGDNSDGAQGTFYEGAMTSGYPSDATENEVQQDIINAGYAITSMNSGPSVTIGEAVSFHVTTPGYTDRYIYANGQDIITMAPQDMSDWQDATFIVQAGHANSQCYSFESSTNAGQFIRHANYQLYMQSDDGTPYYADDSTFCLQSGMSGNGNSVRSFSYPTRYWRHYTGIGYIASDGGPHNFDSASSWTDDVTFSIETGIGG